MVMTNYMDLLAANQPWNLILFMVVPVVLAESLVATEFMMAYRGPENAGGWKGWADELAIVAYLLGIIPFGALALMELGVIGKGLEPRKKLLHHFGWLVLFLIVSHVAMVFGMVDPTITGYKPAPASMHQMDGMPMQHDGMQHNMNGMQK